MTKIALVTGGSRGIGFAIADMLARSGYDLAINGVRRQDEIGDKLVALREHKVRVTYCQGDIGIQGDRKKILSAATGELGPLNLLVNNAGVAPRERKDVLDIEESDFDYLVDINLKGTFFLTQAVAKQMVSEKQKDGAFNACIITISSISAEVASTNRGEYCISKAGLGMVTNLMAVRLAEWNIPVFEIRPGIIETDMTAGVKEKYDKLIGEGLTLQPRWGKPEDVARVVASIAKGDMPYTTGQVIYVDGGLMVRRL